MHLKDFSEIIHTAWEAYDPNRKILSVHDISARVSTNHVYMIYLEEGEKVVGKLSYFGKFEDFYEDHTLINALALNLPAPYEYFVSHSLTKKSQVYVHRYTDSMLDAWVVFYKPMRVDQLLPKKQSLPTIRKLGAELARFHKACHSVSGVLPDWSKSMDNDLQHLLEILETEQGKFDHRGFEAAIKQQIEIFFTEMDKLQVDSLKSIPVFVDWNIGNFSVTADGSFYSRWDYDWFRMSSRVMDFYFFSRVCSEAGDKTMFSYLIDPLMEDRFLEFLSAYHEVFPLSRNEVLLMKEAYRFFILNYVVKDGRYFFHEIYASRLQREAFTIYFPQIDRFNPERINQRLGL
ncbi:MAG: hypothetical protein AAGA85_05405 [Bacteroidota bacterium]